MKIIRLLLQNSGKTFILAAIASLISGMGSAGMIAVINYAIDLPEATSFSQGLFEVEDRDGDLQRSATFKIPDDVEVLPITNITISVPETLK